MLSKEKYLREYKSVLTSTQMAKKKNEAAQAMVAMRNKKLSAKRRKEIASGAARARWAKDDGEQPVKKQEVGN